MEKETGLRVAVVGSGVAGIVAAYLLQREHQVTLFEKNDYIGGHTHTIEIEGGEDRGLAVDTGFIVFNDRTYPNFIRFIGQLGVHFQKAPMSFSYFDPTLDFMYNSSRLFADRRNFFRPSFWKLLLEIVSFNRQARRLIKRGVLTELSLGEFLKQFKFSDNFINQYIIPMGAAIWSTPDSDMMRFPASTFIRFLDNHGLLTINDQPQWYTISGGSREYVRAFLRSFQGEVVKNAGIERIKRSNGCVQILRGEEWQTFDRVVIAAHADQALKLLEDPSEDEKRLLSPWQYTKNEVILHNDISVLPPIKGVWAAWNYIRTEDDSRTDLMTMSYYMNQLQKLETQRDYCVSLNSSVDINPDLVIERLEYSHPLYNFDAVNTQQDLPSLNGVNLTYFCGSYFRYGFHEDAVFSAVQVGKQFGVEL